MKRKLSKILIYAMLKFDNLIRINDKIYLKLLYRYRMGRKLNLEDAQTFNEKLQWLKLYDRKPEYTKMVDKYKVKEYVASIIGKEYIIPTLAIYDNFEDIEWHKLPNQFVIKCTHDSGGVVVCENKSNLDLKIIQKQICKCLRTNYYYTAREWPYKNVKPRIIIEKYMEDKEAEDLKDYKIFCFNGQAKYILVCSNRNGSFKNTDFFDTKWEVMPFTRQNHDNNPKEIKKPKNLDKMIEISNFLAKDIPFVRVDLYEISGKIYFGELTFYPSAGFEGFKPKEWDRKLGKMLQLPEIK